MGRTGRLFAHEWAGLKPDVMAVAKGLGGGFPIGACLATEKAAVGMTAGSHGSTFGGNPLAMAVANAVLDVVLAKDFLEQVEETGRILRGGLEALILRYPEILAGLVAAGENVIRVLPPLIIDEAHVEEALGIFERVCETWDGTS
jgi:acetylornithine/N-succinyldiaminopimelate aminotransferase